MVSKNQYTVEICSTPASVTPELKDKITRRVLRAFKNPTMPVHRVYRYDKNKFGYVVSEQLILVLVKAKTKTKTKKAKAKAKKN